MTNTFIPGPTPDTVQTATGKVLTIPEGPEGWVLLPPGDAVLTRRLKAAGDHWVVQEKRGRKVFSRGVWAPAATIERIRVDLKVERSTEGYAKRRDADAKRREKTQTEYVEDFFGAVVTFLDFHANHADLAQQFAQAVTKHSTPVGSGTVAHTKRIPVEKRAEAAVIAWMRHQTTGQTTGYDNIVIPRVKGKRREVRRMLARRSEELLKRYRQGEVLDGDSPLIEDLCDMGTKPDSPKSHRNIERKTGFWELVKMTLLQIAYILDIVVSLPVAVTTLIGHERGARFLFKSNLPENDNFRIILGSLWMAVLVCSVAGVFFPIAMSPILLLQVIYKALWIFLFAVPRWLSGRGKEVPKRIAVICIATILAFPWVIPWSVLFASTPDSVPL